MIGKTLSHYKILEQIGAGGMGVVYRARDERLGRDVALKLLPAETLGSESARRQLENEARTASALNHPNICTIHDVGEADGQFFVAMEYVEGKPLAQLIPAGGLPEEQVMRYGMQIAEALAHAEHRGVVHRDLKSANVVVTPEGRAKVLDFGLAQQARKEELEEVTRSKVSIEASKGIAGTLAYMAPEVLRGEGADARSDIWALGVMLHEMASGELPFRGATGFELSSAILREPPRSLPARVPAGLRGVTQHCLAKEPGQRYQRAGEVKAALEAIGSGPVAAPAPEPHATFWRSATIASAGVLVLAALLLAFNVGGVRERVLGRGGAPRIQSIAVLPLANMSGDPAQEYFADGMTEALITELAQLSGLKKVTSRTSVMLFKQSKKSMPEIAKDLGVDAIIEGSVQRAGDKVGITVQLIDPAADRHLWAKSYEREVRDILALQREVAGAIVNELRVQLAPADRARLTAASAAARAVNPAAYEAYLLARFHRDRAGPEGRRKAIESFQKALELDPDYALAHAGLAEVYASLGTASVLGVRPQEVMRKAKENALRALELDPNLAEAHTALGLVQLSYEWDFAAAEKQFQQALKLNPNDVNTYHWYSHLWTARGRFEESYAASRRALELDPLNVQMRAHLAWHYVMAGQFEQAVRECDRTLEIHPGSPEAWLFQSLAYSSLGKHNEAITAARKAIEFSGDNPRMVLGLAFAYGRAGRQSEARALLSRFVAPSKAQLVAPYDMARAYVALGNRARAMEWLERAYQERNDYIIYLRVDPFFEPLHSDPHFQDLLRRMNFPR